MADRVKGITIQLGGDTTGLSKALSGVNKEIRDTQSRLKDVERLLKLDPGNTELLRQKQQLLNQSLKETEDKLKTLKEAEKQVQQQFKEGKVSQEQYDALQREIADTEQKVKSLKEQLREFGSVAAQQLQAAGAKMQELGGKIEGAGRKMMPVTGAILGIGAAAVKISADFDSAMSKVSALSGAAGADLDALREKAEALGASTKFSATEVADAYGYMAMAGWEAEDMLNGIGGVLDLAAASGEDLATTCDIVTDALTAFGLSAADAGHFADILAVASSNSNTNVAMMGETFKYVAPAAGALGYEIDDVALAIGLMANSGIKASQAGTALRSIITRLSTDAGASANSLGALGTLTDVLGVEFFDAGGNARDFGDVLTECRAAWQGLTEEEQINYASTIAGQEAMSGWLAIMNASEEDVGKLTGALREADGAAGEMAGTMQDNLNGRLTELKSALEGAAIAIGEALTPLIIKLTEILKSAVDWFNSLDEQQQQAIVTIGLVVAAIGPLLIGFGKIITSVGVITEATGSAVGFITGTAIPAITAGFTYLTGTVLPAVGSAFSSVMGFIIANPIVLLIAAIVGLVALIAVKGDEIQAILQKADDFLQGIFARDWTQVFGPVLGGALNLFLANVRNVWNSAKQILDGIIDFVRGVFTGNWQRAWQGVQNIFAGIFNGLVAIAKAPLNAILGLVNGVISAINGVIGKVSSLSSGGGMGKIGSIPYLARGGILSSGSAIVGEAGPELLTMTGTGAVVQPLTNSTTNNTNLGGVTLNVYSSPGQDVNELANIMMEKFEDAVLRKGATFA